MSVAVPGGALPCDVFGPLASPAIVLLHALTANRTVWRPLARALPSLRLVAPDLRGRGGAFLVAGDSSVEQHAADVRCVLGELGLDRAIIVGHSLGAVVAVALARLVPQRCAGLVLLDGALDVRPRGDGPLPGSDEDTEALICSAKDRLRRTYASTGEHREYWRRRPAVGRYWSPDLEDHLDASLVGEPPSLRVAVNADAVAADLRDLAGTRHRIRQDTELKVPTILLRAARDTQDDPRGTYDAEDVADLVERHDWFDSVEVAGVNHATIPIAAPGVSATAAVVRRLHQTAARPS